MIGFVAGALLRGSDCADMTTDNRLVVTSGWGTIAHVFALDLRDPAPDEAERIASVIERFQHDSYDVRESAAEEIVRIGLPAEPQLRLAMNHDDAEVRVRSRRLREKVLAPEPTAQLSGHLGDVEVVCFTPDGRLLATACRGGSIKIWDASTWNELKTLTIAGEEANASHK
jgi:WD40 repeat protein